MRLEDETVWLTPSDMAALFGKIYVPSEHIQNVIKEGELDEKVVVRNFRLTTQHPAMKGKFKEEQSLKEIEEDIKKLKAK